MNLMDEEAEGLRLQECVSCLCTLGEMENGPETQNQSSFRNILQTEALFFSLFSSAI